MSQFRRWVVALFAVILVGATAFVAHLVSTNIPTSFLTSSGNHSASPSPKPTVTVVAKRGPQLFAGPLAFVRAPANPATVTAPGTELFGWTLIDLRTGKMTGSPNAASATSTMESMIKPWIAADYLRQHPTASKSVLAELSDMIIKNDDKAATHYYNLGGGDGLMKRMTSVCHVSHVGTAKANWWSFTTLSARDAALYAKCIADGSAAGKKWTPWMISTMQQVKGGVSEQLTASSMGGRWGIIDGLPATLTKGLAMKNGATQQGGGWHVDCMAIMPGQWALAIVVQTMKDMPYGATVCANVTKQLVVIG